MQHSLRVHQEQVASPVKDERYEVSARRPLRPIRLKIGTEHTFIYARPGCQGLPAGGCRRVYERAA